jgi:uncharacterized protein YceK
MTRRVATIVTCAVFVLAGCAKVGTLDRPAPLFGERAKAKYRAEKAAETAAKAPKQDNGPPEPLPDAPPPATPPSPPQ